MSTKILQTGTYNSCNKGDAAMEIATSLELEQRGYSVLISTPEPNIDANTYGKKNIVKASRRQVVHGALNLVRASLYWLTQKRIVLQNDPELIATLEADLVVDLSGDMITEDYGVAVALSHFHPLLLARLLNTPYALLAQSIGPFVKTKWLAKRVIRNAVLVTAREKITNENLAKIGLKAVPVTADTAFLLDPEPFNDPYQGTGKMRIGISLSELARKTHNKTGRDIVDDLVTVFFELSCLHSIEILGIPHVTGPTSDKDDSLILNELSDRGLSMTVLGDLSPGALKTAVSSCDVHIGARMHSNIAALSSSTPVIALSYSHKTAGIMQEFDLNDLVLNLGHFDSHDLKTLLSHAIASKEQISQTISQRLEATIQRSYSNFDLIDTFFQTTETGVGQET